jgi:hypothetical protein
MGMAGAACESGCENASAMLTPVFCNRTPQNSFLVMHVTPIYFCTSGVIKPMAFPSFSRHIALKKITAQTFHSPFYIDHT